MHEKYTQLPLDLRTKPCLKCGRVLPFAAYDRHPHSPHGLHGRCKECRKVDKAASYVACRERVLAHQKEYRERNREQIAERRGARRRENIEDALAREQARRDAERVTHGDKIRAYYREYQQKNREKRRAYEVARYPKNRDKNRERTARWHAENPEKSAALRARRRAWVAGAAIKDFTAEQWQTCKEYFQGHCAYCGKPFDALTQDHVVPLSRGGNHTAANIVPACQSCNSRKNDRTLMEYLMLG